MIEDGLYKQLKKGKSPPLTKQLPYYLNMIMTALVIVFIAYCIFNRLLNMGVVLLFVVLLLCKLSAIVYNAYNFDKLKNSCNPAELRFFILRQAKNYKMECYQELFLFKYCVLTGDMKNALELKKKLEDCWFNDLNRDEHVTVKLKPWEDMFLRYLHTKIMAYVSDFNFLSIEKEYQNIMSSKVMENNTMSFLAKFPEYFLAMIQGDGDGRLYFEKLYQEEKYDIYLYYLLLNDILNNNADNYDDFKHDILKGSPETFYYQIIASINKAELIELSDRGLAGFRRY